MEELYYQKETKYSKEELDKLGDIFASMSNLWLSTEKAIDIIKDAANAMTLFGEKVVNVTNKFLSITTPCFSDYPAYLRRREKALKRSQRNSQWVKKRKHGRQQPTWVRRK